VWARCYSNYWRQTSSNQASSDRIAPAAHEPSTDRRSELAHERITIPLLSDVARNAIETILARRVELARLQAQIAEVIDPAALGSLTEFYRQSGGDLRRVLAAAHEAAEHAAGDQAAHIGLSHARFGIAQWQ
jgi:Cdc6-like AAA superfamily ATPase